MNNNNETVETRIKTIAKYHSKNKYIYALSANHTTTNNNNICHLLTLVKVMVYDNTVTEENKNNGG